MQFKGFFAIIRKNNGCIRLKKDLSAIVRSAAALNTHSGREVLVGQILVIRANVVEAQLLAGPNGTQREEHEVRQCHI